MRVATLYHNALVVDDSVDCTFPEPRPGFVAGEAMPAAMPPGRANGLYVVVVGEGVRRPFLRGAVNR